jgi:hypothetical protein
MEGVHAVEELQVERCGLLTVDLRFGRISRCSHDGESSRDFSSNIRAFQLLQSEQFDLNRAAASWRCWWLRCCLSRERELSGGGKKLARRIWPLAPPLQDHFYISHNSPYTHIF